MYGPGLTFTSNMNTHERSEMPSLYVDPNSPFKDEVVLPYCSLLSVFSSWAGFYLKMYFPLHVKMDICVKMSTPITHVMCKYSRKLSFMYGHTSLSGTRPSMRLRSSAIMDVVLPNERF
jgi:hypothetical protein